MMSNRTLENDFLTTINCSIGQHFPTPLDYFVARITQVQYQPICFRFLIYLPFEQVLNIWIFLHLPILSLQCESDIRFSYNVMFFRSYWADKHAFPPVILTYTTNSGPYCVYLWSWEWWCNITHKIRCFVIPIFVMLRNSHRSNIYVLCCMFCVTWLVRVKS